MRKAEDVQIERVKVDSTFGLFLFWVFIKKIILLENVSLEVRDLELSNFPSLKGRKFVGLSKHLCGSATGEPFFPPKSLLLFGEGGRGLGVGLGVLFHYCHSVSICCVFRCFLPFFVVLVRHSKNVFDVQI